MEIRNFDWDEESVSHIARHGVDPEEVEEVFENRVLIRRTRNQCYAALGRSDSGRYLMVVFKHLTGRDLKVITARNMDGKEKRIFRRETDA